MTKDLLQRFIFENEPVRGEYVKLENSFQTVLSQHDYPPAVRKILGEGLCAAALLSAIIKFEGKLTVQFRGKGKLKLLLAQCNDKNHVRGLAKYDGDLSYEELMSAFQEGILMIMLDSGPNSQRYQGVVEWQGNSLAESIQGYFRNSEQLATKIWLQSDEQTAVGFLLQVIPVTENNSREFEKEIVNPSWHRITKQTEAADMDVIMNTPYPEFLTQLYPDETIRIFDSSEVEFHCGCTRKRGEEAIGLLGREEAEEELKDKQCIAVTCDFCNKEYLFDRADVEAIFEKNRGAPPSDIQLH